MTINHLNLPVADVAGAVRFFETYFEFSCEQIKGDNMIAALTNRENFVLVLMSSAMNRKGASGYPDAFHIGFMLRSTEEVDGLYRKLIDGAVRVEKQPGKIRNSYGFYFHFEDILIEIGHYTS